MYYKLSWNLGRPGFHSVYPEVCKARYFIKGASGRNFWSEKVSFQLLGFLVVQLLALLMDCLSPGHRLNDGGWLCRQELGRKCLHCEGVPESQELSPLSLCSLLLPIWNNS